MKVIKINKNSILNDQKIINQIINFFKDGKVVVYPTDTIYGLGCSAFKDKALKKIYKIKKRDNKKPLLLLTDSIKSLKTYCLVNKNQEEYIKKKYKKYPISFILSGKKNINKKLLNSDGGVAFRIPNEKFLLKILKKLKHPIVSTSVNISGKDSLTNLNEIKNYFKKTKPDLIINIGDLKNKPSKIIDLRNPKKIIVVRK